MLCAEDDPKDGATQFQHPYRAIHIPFKLAPKYWQAELKPAEELRSITVYYFGSSQGSRQGIVPGMRGCDRCMFYDLRRSVWAKLSQKEKDNVLAEGRANTSRAVFVLMP